MKRVITFFVTAMLLVGCLTLTGCGSKKTITLEEIDKGTQTAAILKNYTSFQCTSVNAEDGYTMKQYVDKDMFYVTYPEQTALYLNGTLRYISIGETLAGALYVLQEPYEFQLKENLLFTKDDAETIKSCEEKDGKIYVTTEVTAAATKKLVENDGYTYNDGDYLTIDYILDAKTHALLSDKNLLVAKDGTKRDYVTVTIEYNVARPDLAQTMYEHATATENLRTLTLITDPDTESEKSFTIQVPKGDAVQPYIDEAYKTLFTDRACTEPLTAAERNADSTVYMKRGK